MDHNQEERLNSLLSKRRDVIESLRFFDEYFERLVFFELKDVVSEINQRLMMASNEMLRIFNENPYEHSKTRYFSMIQLFTENDRKRGMFFDKTYNYPSLIIEGDEFKANVNIYYRINEKKENNKVFPISELLRNGRSKLYDIIIEFLEKTLS